MIMDIKKFKQLLTKHKCVIVQYEPACEANNPFTMRYELKESGLILECYDYNRTIYPVCYIQDERAMADNFMLNDEISITPSKPVFVNR